MGRPDKLCRRCGRPFAWRKKWAREWEFVRYCSERCRRTRLTPGDKEIEAAIVAMLSRRDPDKSLCPSEVARRMAPEEWRANMPAVRAGAARLVGSGRVSVTQGPREVHPMDAKGPIRLRRGPRFDEG